MSGCGFGGKCGERGGKGIRVELWRVHVGRVCAAAVHMRVLCN